MRKETTQDQGQLREATRETFEPRAERRLSDEELREIGQNLVGFFSILREWAKAESEIASASGKEAVTNHGATPTRRPGGQTEAG